MIYDYFVIYFLSFKISKYILSIYIIYLLISTNKFSSTMAVVLWAKQFNYFLFN